MGAYINWADAKNFDGNSYVTVCYYMLLYYIYIYYMFFVLLLVSYAYFTDGPKSEFRCRFW